MKTFGEKLKEARLAQHLNQEELAERVGAKYRSVSTWENGTAKPDYATLIRLCEVLNTSPNYLLGYNLNVDTPSLVEMTMLRKYRYIDERGKKVVDTVLATEYNIAVEAHKRKQKIRKLRIDYYNYPASAGTGNFLESETPEEIWVAESTAAEDADFVLPVSGDSMEPTFHDGDKVFVEKCETVEEGEIGIFILNGEAFIKELGKRCLISHNEAYKPIKLGAPDSIYCCGRVLGVVEE